MAKNHLTHTTRPLAGNWFVLGIDLFLIAVSFFLAYLIRYNLEMSFNVSNFALQLLVVVLLALPAFLITGSYKGMFRQTGVRHWDIIFKTIGLWSLFIILFTLINRILDLYPWFSIPLSIILLSSLLSFAGLTAVHYGFKGLYRTLVK
jgi:FlaA1/EpsC-like NDP-sugar epimerase